ncbi:annexin B9-like [Palaemon carinicauda]|uniref:annexin B9-like n=1 Tax=Palaemon carinicauda TaxID=392227 RepID=UPI0035B6A86D
MQGMRPDEEIFIEVLCKRTPIQRQEIRRIYEQEYRRDLVSDARHKLHGKFGDVVVSLLTPLPKYLAQELHRAIRTSGKDSRVFFEVFCNCDNMTIRAIKQAYYKCYALTLECAVKSHCGQLGDDFQTLLEKLVSNERDEDDVAMLELPMRIAKQLYQAVEGAGGSEPDKDELRRIFTTYSYETLREVFKLYCEVSGKKLEEVLRGRAVSDEFYTGLFTAYYSIRNPATFFAWELRSSVEGPGTRDRLLIRLIVTRNQVDMGAIKAEYKRMFNRSLKKDIKGDTHGNYRKILLGLVDS